MAELIGDGEDINTMDFTEETGSERTYALHILVPMVRELGLTVKLIDWRNCEDIQWHQYQLFVWVAVWDYHECPEEFMRFLIKLKSLGVKTINSLDFILWNLSKTYLLELSSTFNVPETIII
jgi:menaquinone-dependent protoporphyrinogen IX oxidase